MNRDPDWHLYRTLLAVLEHGSLSAAARELGLTQPTVGRHIDALEEAIGSQLFVRSPNGLLPTDAALELKPYAQTLAATSAALLRTASGHRERVAGTVRISASEVIGVEILPPILAPLIAAHPDLNIELSASDAIEDLLNREADIAVRMAEPVQEQLIGRRIGEIPLGFHAHRRYLDQHGMPQQIADLTRHRLVGFDRQTAYIRTMMARFPLPDGLAFGFKSDNPHAQIAAIRAGLGIGICQIGIAARDPDLLPVLPECFRIPLDTWVVMHEGIKTARRYRVTFDALVDGLTKYVKGTARKHAG
ncbi:LysR family transcriptional regulator [Rhizobium sp. R72]|uniref:LysR family transcriptional regulator n=1 Tax=unclassified Rhizobium TaxID=2613769 RepID=UPI000B5350DF|nr:MULTISPECIES: LysR family transcriptional regulator [unclassified Rhizobium]OWV93275.1 LysR family transcriptional regulator [Rhizobium sp. R72]OWV93502.1 LysR family transcriptional regulator [Rhizobium sp. R711]